MISDARGSHVSPGIYTEERDVTYSVKSLGITSLGLVGETLYGPAFQNMEIESWGEYVDYFGGTSTEKFPGTQLPKYELPYIAKSYLEKSNRLNVVRVLGLSGYDAGPCWVLHKKNDGTNAEEGNPDIIAILRSKMEYVFTSPSSGNCTNSSGETITALVSDIEVKRTNSGTTNASTNCGENKYNAFYQLTVTLFGGGEVTYNFSLNKDDSNYIYNVLGNNPNGTSPVYIESLFEANLTNLSENNVELTMTSFNSVNSNDEMVYFNVAPVKDSNDKPLECEGGKLCILTKVDKNTVLENDVVSGTTNYGTGVVCFKEEMNGKTYYAIPNDVKNDYLRDYNQGFRAAETPWIISECNENYESGTHNTSVYMYSKKLFKLHTISDGNNANYQVKVSIQNINVKNGTFDVIVRDFNDSDEYPIILEQFTKCNLVEGDANYIAYKIGTFDGGFISKSKYILVEMAEGDLSKNIPAGFMGYPMPKYDGFNTPNPIYNTTYDENIKVKKQYFGFSKKTGIETDFLSYKGKVTTFETLDENVSLTKGFHLDGGASGISIDNNSVYEFSVVEGIDRTSIYEDVKRCKFTVCFYGGFDGWDIHRTERTNTNEYKATKYNVNGGSSAFSAYIPEENGNLPLNLPKTAITSDYYAYLAGCRVFANPQDIDINIFATPGINWSDHNLLTQEIIEMIEDSDDGRGGDALYVMESPNLEDMTSIESAIEDAEISSSYACTYFPWVMYYDASNRKYLELPVTKDVVRNMAETDNTSYPWFAPAGMQRGNVNCVKANIKTSLADEDILYSNCINPVKSYAQDGVKIWGNKTMYNTESPLNRVNVRRLLIRVKKMVTEAAKHLIFEQYDEAIEKQFKGIVEPILADVKANRGIVDYRVITECTPETRDQHILPAKILIKPTQSLEYISLSFVVYPESVSFDNE